MDVAGAVRCIDWNVVLPGPRLAHFSWRVLPAAFSKSVLVRPWPQLDRPTPVWTEDSTTCSSALMPTSFQ